MSIGDRTIASPAKAQRARFASLPTVAAIAATGLMALGLLYRDTGALAQAALEHASSDAVAEQYVMHLLHARPQDTALRMRLAEQRLSRGQYEAALTTLQPLLQLDDPERRFEAAYLAVRTLAEARRAAHPASPERAAIEARFRTQLSFLAVRNGDSMLLERGSPTEIRRLLEDAKMLGDAELTARLLDCLAELEPERAVAEYASLAQLSLGRGDYLQSARFYWQARRLETDHAQQRALYLASLHALQSGNLLAETLAESEREMGDLVEDQQVLYAFIVLARAANRPDIAARYARRLMLTAR